MISFAAGQAVKGNNELPDLSDQGQIPKGRQTSLQTEKDNFRKEETGI